MLAPMVHDSLVVEVPTSAEIPTPIDIHKALRAQGFGHKEAKEVTLRAQQTNELVTMLRRLLAYPLALIVRRVDVRQAAKLAGLSEPPWPVSDENMSTRVLLDKELLRQNVKLKQLVHDFVYKDVGMIELCEGAGVPVQAWMGDPTKQKKG
jgi:hypothetical protein